MPVSIAIDTFSDVGDTGIEIFAWAAVAATTGLAVVALLLRRSIAGGRPLRWGGTPARHHYRAVHLMTPTERAFFTGLRKTAAKRGILTLAKVRLGDLIRAEEKDRGGRAKVNQKHVDFVLCDAQTLGVIVVIELDDRSHDRPDRRRRDEFVDSALGMAGIPIRHVRVRRSTSLTELLRGTSVDPNVDDEIVATGPDVEAEA